YVTAYDCMIRAILWIRRKMLHNTCDIIFIGITPGVHVTLANCLTVKIDQYILEIWYNLFIFLIGSLCIKCFMKQIFVHLYLGHEKLSFEIIYIVFYFERGTQCNNAQDITLLM
ncbi:hypothetical protein ACJX0J_021553, partial [Zea mays]